MERVKKDVDANSDEPQRVNDKNDENSEFDPNLMLEKSMEEKLLEHMKGEIPAHVPSVIEAVRVAFHKYVEGLNYVNDPSKLQALAYEACDRTRMPLHTLKMLETC